MPPQFPFDQTAWTTGTGATINANVWTYWATTATTSTALTYTDPGYGLNAGVWQAWTTTGTYYAPPAYVPREQTPEEIWQAAQRVLISANRARSGKLRAKRAERTAEELLLSTLNDEQTDEYRRLERFGVVVGDRTYRIRKGMHGNIDVIEDDTIVERLCVYAQGGVPAQDNMLAQKLLLETDEEHLRRTANITRLRLAA